MRLRPLGRRWWRQERLRLRWAVPRALGVTVVGNFACDGWCWGALQIKAELGGVAAGGDPSDALLVLVEAAVYRVEDALRGHTKDVYLQRGEARQDGRVTSELQDLLWFACLTDSPLLGVTVVQH